MRVITEKQVGDLKVCFKELTLAEIRAWLESGKTPQKVTLEDTLFEEEYGLLVSDFPAFSDANADSLGSLAPSELEIIAKEIREVNARFFVTWKRHLEKVAASLLPMS